MGVLYSDSTIHSFSICLPAEDSSAVFMKYRVVVSSMYIELPFLRLEDVYCGNIFTNSGYRGGVPYSLRSSGMQGSLSLK
jgi:hypothetical protein